MEYNIAVESETYVTLYTRYEHPFFNNLLRFLSSFVLNDGTYNYDNPMVSIFKIADKYGDPSFKDTTPDQVKSATKELLTHLDAEGFKIGFVPDQEDMVTNTVNDAFLEFIEEDIPDQLGDTPEGNYCLAIYVATVYYYLMSVDTSNYAGLRSFIQEFDFLMDSYENIMTKEKLMSDYRASGELEVVKGIENIPHYLLEVSENIEFKNGKWYWRMLDAAGAVASSLETQDLESKITNAAPQKLVKKFKPKKKVEEHASESNVDR